VTRTEEKRIADNMIGAAQRLEAAAKLLKEQARHVRGGVLHRTMTADLWTMHKADDIKRTAERALAEITGHAVTLCEWQP
jgi:hypothetical protein